MFGFVLTYRSVARMAIAEVSAPANLRLATVSRKDGSGEGNLTFGEGLRIELLSV